jgi:hypothetical protein
MLGGEVMGVRGSLGNNFYGFEYVDLDGRIG